MNVKTFLNRLAEEGLFEIDTVRRRDGSRYILFEDDKGKRYMSDHPEDYQIDKRLGLLNDFLSHYGIKSR